MRTKVQNIIGKYQKDASRLMDILIDIQDEIGYIPDEVTTQLAEELNISYVDVEQTISFYHFFSQKPRGKYNVYLNDSVVANLMGRKKVADTFEKEVSCKFGQVSSDGMIGLYNTSCIGMNDQEPAAIINGKVFTRLTPYRVKEIVNDMKAGKNLDEMITEGYGGGNNGHELVKSMVNNSLRKKGPILSDDFISGEVILKKLPSYTPEVIIDIVKKSNLRGRGGAGFPTGLKWEFCRASQEDERYVFCNADEGEPGTFKDRVILTEKPKMLFEGMVVAGYAIRATMGVLYLRYEYKYLQDFLEDVLEGMRERNLLGNNIAGIEGFNFDIRIQFGAGAYVCGEESALIESAEGKRGEPRDRPPFPVEKGYLYKPTVVNNVETLCSVVRIIEKGADWWKSHGTKDSSGYKILSISGDCRFPGIYEVEWGMSIHEILEMTGADVEDIQAVQVGGPSGTLIAPNEFNRTICYADLSTGGSMIIIGKYRDLIRDVVLNFMEFFMEESCGSCSTCRNLPRIMKTKVEKIINGKGVAQDIDDLLNWGNTLKASRCGLGQTAGNPVLTSVKNFRKLYESYIQKDKDYDTGFNLEAAIQESCKVVGREAKLHHN